MQEINEEIINEIYIERSNNTEDITVGNYDNYRTNDKTGNFYSLRASNKIQLYLHNTQTQSNGLNGNK